MKDLLNVSGIFTLISQLSYMLSTKLAIFSARLKISAKLLAEGLLPNSHFLCILSYLCFFVRKGLASSNHSKQFSVSPLAFTIRTSISFTVKKMARLERD